MIARHAMSTPIANVQQLQQHIASLEDERRLLKNIISGAAALASLDDDGDGGDSSPNANTAVTVEMLKAWNHQLRVKLAQYEDPSTLPRPLTTSQPPIENDSMKTPTSTPSLTSAQVQTIETAISMAKSLPVADLEMRLKHSQENCLEYQDQIKQLHEKISDMQVELLTAAAAKPTSDDSSTIPKKVHDRVLDELQEAKRQNSELQAEKSLSFVSSAALKEAQDSLQSVLAAKGQLEQTIAQYQQDLASLSESIKQERVESDTLLQTSDKEVVRLQSLIQSVKNVILSFSLKQPENAENRDVDIEQWVQWCEKERGRLEKELLEAHLIIDAQHERLMKHNSPEITELPVSTSIQTDENVPFTRLSTIKAMIAAKSALPPARNTLPVAAQHIERLVKRNADLEETFIRLSERLEHQLKSNSDIKKLIVQSMSVSSPPKQRSTSSGDLDFAGLLAHYNDTLVEVGRLREENSSLKVRCQEVEEIIEGAFFSPSITDKTADSSRPVRKSSGNGAHGSSAPLDQHEHHSPSPHSSVIPQEPVSPSLVPKEVAPIKSTPLSPVKQVSELSKPIETMREQSPPSPGRQISPLFPQSQPSILKHSPVRTSLSDHESLQDVALRLQKSSLKAEATPEEPREELPKSDVSIQVQIPLQDQKKEEKKKKNSQPISFSYCHSCKDGLIYL